MKKSVVRAATLLLTTVLFVSMMQPVTAYYGEAYDAFDRDASQQAESGDASSERSGGRFETSSKYDYSSMRKKIQEYKQTNSDVTGWLIIPGTNINEPILKTKKNAYYMNRDWKGANYPNNNWQNFTTTATYADSRTRWAGDGQSWDKNSRNTVLYGHNWTNLRTPLDIGSNNRHIMFGQLPSYTDLTFAQNNPYIYFSTGENEGIWKVFCVAYCEMPNSKFTYNVSNPDDGEYKKLLSEWKARSLFDFDTEVGTGDRILTLSTCSRMYANMGSNQRYVVVARLLRDGESENDKVTVAVNSDMKKPQF